MTQHVFATDTTFLSDDLDANFTELYGLTTNFRVTGGNVGIGVTPDAWTGTGASALELGSAGSAVIGGTAAVDVLFNAIYNSSWKYAHTGASAGYFLLAGQHQWAIAASGTVGAALTWTTPMTLDSSGYLLLGYASSNGAYKLQVNSQIFATSATIATSDARYKRNVMPVAGALDLVQRLRPVSFTWKPHPVHAFDTDQRQIGFLAQEVQAALADAPWAGAVVCINDCTLPDGSTESFLGLAEASLVPLLTAALQEQQRLIEQLSDRLARLEGAPR